MAQRLKGISAANGIAIAPLIHFHGDLEFIPLRTLEPGEVVAEVARLEDAIAQASKGILGLRKKLAADLSDHDAQIYDAQLSILHDEAFVAELARTVEQNLCNAEVAVQQVVSRFEKVFEGMEDAAMRERASDLRDVARQVLAFLMELERSVHMAHGQDFIFAAEEFLPSDAGAIDRTHLRGIVTARGGKYSHGAILARSLGIPSVVAVEDVLRRVQSGAVVIVDGDSGIVIASPDAEDIERYERRAAEHAEVERRVFEVRVLRARTPDGAAIRLMANVERARDLDALESDVVDGIGLFRTEFAFMERHQFPTEEEQVAMYRRAIVWAKGKVVTFRTLDVGGDKPLPYLQIPAERNPVLGWRGLRICLDWPDLFYTQVRALLRASAGGHARILLPMVTTVEEVARCRAVLDELKADLAAAGVPHDPAIELGTMVEVPAFAAMLDVVLPLVDFVSVGTNDLVQYLLAVDRDNPRIAQMYNPYHPGVLRFLRDIAHKVRSAGRPISICGEIAGDHYFTALLLGLGFRELSMTPVFLPRVKLMVRTFDIPTCERIAAQVLEAGSAPEARTIMREHAQAGWSRFLQGN